MARRLVLVFFILAGGTMQGVAQERGPHRYAVEAADSAQTNPADLGQMWALHAMPRPVLEQRYGTAPSSEWRSRLQGAVVRLPGCSGTLVSGRGIVLTTRSCVDEYLPTGAKEEAFVAEGRDQERSLDGLHVDRLVSVTDVTNQVLNRAANSEAVAQARREVEAERQEDAPAQQRVDVVREGGTFVAYTYERFQTVRLVFAPGGQAAEFGGVEASFSYPRAAFDVALLRVYEDGEPLSEGPYVSVEEDGPSASVYAAGFPARTSRVSTPAELAFEREIALPARRDLQAALVQGVPDASDAAQVGGDRRRYERAVKETKGQLDALRSDAVQARIQSRFDSLRATGGRLATIIDSLSMIQEQKRDLRTAYRAFQPFSWPSGSVTLRRALWAIQSETATSPAVDSLRDKIQSVASRPAEFDAAVLARQLHWLRRVEEADTMSVGDRMQQARSIVDESRFAATRAGDAISLEDDYGADPAVEVLQPLMSEYRAFRDDWSRLRQRESRLSRELRQRLVAGRSDSLVLPSRRSLRVADGRISGYPYNGTVAPPITTPFWMLAAHHADDQPAWQLPARWRDAPNAFDRATPLTFAARVDPAGGMNGSGVFSADGSLVGVLFDRNVQALASPYLYLPEEMRAAGVHAQGLLEALEHLYDAPELVEEMTSPPPADR